MRRRRFLAVSVGSGSILAGCSTVEEADEPEPEPEPGNDGNSNSPDTSTPQVEEEEEDSIEIPSHLAAASGNTSPNFDNESQYQRTYTQTTDGHYTEFEMRVPEALYDYYESRLRIQPTTTQEHEYGVYVADQYDTNYLDWVADEFEAYGQRNGLSDRQVIDQVIGFVQQLEYTTDQVNNGYSNYPQFPIETLVLREGDCEDTSILMASLFNRMGYDTVLVESPGDQHLAVGIAGEESITGSYYQRNGTRYYYVEATAPGFAVGEIPNNFEADSVYLHDVHGLAILVYAWEAQPKRNGVDIEVGFQNVGNSMTRDARIQAGIENNQGQFIDSVQSNSHSLRPESSESTTLSLRAPADERLRLTVDAVINQKIQDRDQSEWYSP